MFGLESEAKTLQLATRAVTPRQREVQYDFPVASSCLPSLLILATAVLTTNGTARLQGPAIQSAQDSMPTWKRWLSHYKFGSEKPRVKEYRASTVVSWPSGLMHRS